MTPANNPRFVVSTQRRKRGDAEPAGGCEGGGSPPAAPGSCSVTSCPSILESVLELLESVPHSSSASPLRGSGRNGTWNSSCDHVVEDRSTFLRRRHGDIGVVR